MLTKEDNERLCRVGPAAPAGALFRRYWLPITTSDRLPEPGCAPVAERLLGEDFVVFRTKEGKVGVLDELCMHRGASLVLGRVEDCGIRCIYHGWKFGTDGEVLEIMNNPEGKRAPRFRAPAYPCVEAGGLIWVYLGPPDKQPPFFRRSFMDTPEDHRVIIRVDTHYNWVQAIEGGLDSSHVSILHTNVARPSWAGESDVVVGAMNDTSPLLEIEDTEFGYHYAAFRRMGEGRPDNVRIVPFMMPSGRIIPNAGLSGAVNSTLLLEIPIDDEHTATYSIRYGEGPQSAEGRWYETGFTDPRVYSAETRRLLVERGDYKQRRDRMDTDWTGYRGIAIEDAAIATSMRPIVDRTKEHLIASDLAVVRFRRLLLESIARMERGEDPIGAASDFSQVVAVDGPRPSGAHWRTLAPTHRVPASPDA